LNGTLRPGFSPTRQIFGIYSVLRKQERQFTQRKKLDGKNAGQKQDRQTPGKLTENLECSNDYAGNRSDDSQSL
jgi:hypothetical protein